MRKLFIAGNWKMNLSAVSAAGLAGELASGFPSAHEGVDVLVAPPFPYLGLVREQISNSGVMLGAQNAWCEPSGAYTGEVSVEMLTDVGCQYVILGHSERRHVLNETDDLINRKFKAALAGGLDVILCVGELQQQRENNETEQILDGQIDGCLADVDATAMEHVVIAYEPVWAIGTGLTATPDQAQSAHAHLRRRISDRYNSGVGDQVRIQYGGSVKPSNAAELLNQPDVDGALVGGASLKAADFLPIVNAAVDMAA